MPEQKSLDERLDEIRRMKDNEQWRTAFRSIDKMIKELSADDSNTSSLIAARLLKADILIDTTDLEKAQTEAEIALGEARRTKDASLEAEALLILGNILRKEGDFKAAQDHMTRALDIAKAKDLSRIQGMAHLELGVIFSQLKGSTAGDMEYRQAILDFERAKDLRGLARTYHNFAARFILTHDWEKAIEMFTKCQTMSERIDYKQLQAWAGFNKAECLMELGRYEEAINALDRSMANLERLKDLRGIVGASIVYGLVLAKKGNFDQSEARLLEALGLSRRNKIPVDIAKVLAELGRVNKWRGDKVKAKKYFTQALEVLKKLGHSKDMEMIQSEMSSLD